MSAIKKASKIGWNEIETVGLPQREHVNTPSGAPRQFLCRGEYSIFVSTMFDDLSGFADEGDDRAKAWAMIENF